MIRKKTSNPARGAAAVLDPWIAGLLGDGLAQFRADDLARARETLRLVLAVEPRQADALHLIGVTFLDEDPGQAETFIREAVAADPHNPLHHANLGLALRLQGRFEEALSAYDKALRRKRDYLEAHVARGLVLRELGRLPEAVDAFGAALGVKPDHLPALKARGDTLSELLRFDEAVAAYGQLLAQAPGDVATLNNCGIALLESNRPTEALANFDAALALSPESAEVVNNRGNALKALGRLDQARLCFERAISLAPQYVDAIVNLGSTLQDQARFDEALVSYVKARDIDPMHARAHWNEATLRLLTGDLPGGFAAAEWRWKVPALRLSAPPSTQPPWLGDGSVAGKTVLVHADLGLGDTIQFARYIPALAARGARVIAQVQPSLVGLIGTVEGVADCVPTTRRPPRFDLHCSLSSLPLAFATTLDTIPAPIPYLSSGTAAAWQDRLGSEGPKVGLVWSGNARHSNDRNRSIPVAMLSSLFDLDATFVSLQTEVREADQAALSGANRVVMAGPLLKSFADTAALVSALDLVITVDTSVAHLAGALGKPVWILLPHVPDWRWLLDRQDSPWYPTARLFRQGPDRSWGPVIARVAEAFAAEFSRSR